MTIKEQLDQNIPREVITTREQSGKSLSYLETWYVIDRLNQVLGTDNWSWEIKEFTPIPGEKLSYICQGTISAIIDGNILMSSISLSFIFEISPILKNDFTGYSLFD